MRLVLVLLLASGALVSFACRSQVEHVVNPKPGVEPETSLTHVPQFTDIPVPASFRVQRDRLESYVAEVGKWRSGQLLYHGEGRPLDAVAYFEERLPQHGWRLSDRGTSTDQAFLEFTKGDSKARLNIASLGASGIVELKIRVTTGRTSMAEAAGARSGSVSGR
jgi:hypothetical protein